MAGKKRNVEFVENPTLEQFSMMVEALSLIHI